MFNEDFKFASHLSNAATWTGRVEVFLASGSSWAESSCAVCAALMSLTWLLLVWENKSLGIPMSYKFRWSYARTSLDIAAILSDLLLASVRLRLEREATFVLVSTGFTATLELYDKALNRLCQRKSCHYFPAPK